MGLKQNDWHYESVLYAKRQAIWHAAELIKTVKKSIEDKQQEMDAEVFKEAMHAIELFKENLRTVNGPHYGYEALNNYSNSFFNTVENGSLGPYVSLNATRQCSIFRRYLAKQDNAETLSSRRKNFLIKTLIHSLVPALIALYAVSWFFIPLLAFCLFAAYHAPMTIVFASILSMNEASKHRVVERNIISQGIAIHDLHHLLEDEILPSAPVDATLPIANAYTTNTDDVVYTPVVLAK